MLACFGVIDTRIYGSRFLGVFIFYLTGSLVYDINFGKENKRLEKYLLGLLWLVALGLYLVLTYAGKILLDYNKPILLGYLILLPIFLALSKIKARRAWDDWLGNLSYGMYLNHFLLIWIFSYLNIFSSDTNSDRWLKALCIIPLSIGFSFLSFNFIDEKLRTVRLKFRQEPLPAEGLITPKTAVEELRVKE